jgi:hypothetical protein
MSVVLDGQLHDIVNILSASAGLGTAAMGLVDATKVFSCGGVSAAGFRHIVSALQGFLPAGQQPGGAAAFGREQILETLRANWLNGVPKADQKAKAKALVHLGLTSGNAAGLATAAGVDANVLTALTTKIAAGQPATPQELNVLGQFDAVLSAVLDAAYERADQRYRNVSKVLALFFSTLLGAIGGWVIADKGTSLAGYLSSSDFMIALMVGLSGTPLAPIAKDLTTTLQASVAAIRAVKR